VLTHAHPLEQSARIAIVAASYLELFEAFPRTAALSGGFRGLSSDFLRGFRTLSGYFISRCFRFSHRDFFSKSIFSGA
jgi:hypothetical protein